MRRNPFRYCFFFVLQLVLIGSAVADDPPGVVINTSPDFETIYIGSPSIAILPSGDYVATHNWYGPGSTGDETVVFKSSDRGKTWNQIAEINGQFWSTLFVHRSAVYLMGASKQNGSLVIRRSNDQGKTWTNPIDHRTGIIQDGPIYTAPVPVTVHGGRIWRSFEQTQRKDWLTMVVSADEDADLLNADNWVTSNPVYIESTQFAGTRDRLMEGNVVAIPGSGVFNIARVDSRRPGRAAMLPVSDDGRKQELSLTGSFIELPGGRSKFTIRYDPISQRFWGLTNKQRSPFARRNVLVLVSSTDLRQWEVNTTLLHHVDPNWHSFHYADWQFDGDDLIAVCQTAWDKSRGTHKNNYFTFHRIKNFRGLKPEHSASVLGRINQVEFEHRDFRLQGTDFRVEDFENGTTAFTTFNLTFQDIPPRFQGWRFTRTIGGRNPSIELTAKTDGPVYFATAMDQDAIDVTGWKLLDKSFHFSDQRKSRMLIFEKTVNSGETIRIPQGNWSGGMVLIPPET